MARSRSDPAARRSALAATALLIALLAGPAGAVSASPPSAAEDACPADTTPPAGTRYPCALTALPRALPGIPEGDRTYVNRTYTRILRATQAKLVLLKALEDGSDVPAALTRYQDATRRLAEQLAAERSEEHTSEL